MKILHIISSLEVGGAQRLLSDLLPLLAQQHEVTLLVNTDIDNAFTSRVKDVGINVIVSRLHVYSWRNIFFIRKLLDNYDIVHVHLFPTVYWAAFACFSKRTRLVYTEHSTSNRRREKWFLRPVERFVYSRYWKIISISRQTQDALTAWLKTGNDDKRFVTINNGIDLVAFPMRRRQSHTLRTLIQVSRFEASKDQDSVIKAMTLLPSDMQLLLVGDGRRLEECKTLAESLGCSNRIHFLGARSDISALLLQADIAVQASHWEGFGLTAIEAMACGLPVIASDVPGLKQVVEDYGLLFTSGDTTMLARQIMRIVTDPALYEALSAKSVQRASHYDIRTMAKKYLALYGQDVIPADGVLSQP
jgi:glycosyltransferase involved in cell wall biosynthesis